MSDYQTLAVLAAFAFLYSLIAAKLERTPVNGALVYVAVGLLCGPSGLGLIDLDADAEVISWLAELTLAVVLFTDSAGADLKTLRRIEAIPMRLLLLGLPLTIALGFGVGIVFFRGQLGLFEIALLATMLAPTDAALGKAVVTNESVPNSVRESLNVESGLNDGICVPVLLLFLALASDEAGDSGALSLAALLLLQAIGIGTAVGIGLGVAGSRTIHVARSREWLTGTWLQIPVIALSLLCFALAQWLGGSGFIASFVGGITFGALKKEPQKAALEAADGTGNVLALLTWFTFGSSLFFHPAENTSWRVIGFAVASLTIIRMIPVFVCVAGLKMRTDTRLFMGWFGPRGLASIVFAVLVIGHRLPGGGLLVVTTAWTILLSVIAHGLSANPLATAYSRRVGDKAI
jgi:NhaP-type Na+/H+ or K+/H+ antiporter